MAWRGANRLKHLSLSRALLSVPLLALLPFAALAATMQPVAEAAPAPTTTTEAPTTPQQASAPRPVPLLPVEVIARFPHDPGAYTQGLLVHDGHFYESTGREGQSGVRRVDIESGRVLARNSIAPDQFGEGLALWGERLISLTWQHGVAHRWNLHTLARDGAPFRYRGQGWGLATTADGLVMSDGSSTLRFLNGDNFTEQRRVNVTVARQPLVDINELEVIDGRIWANDWMTDFIYIIDPATGVVSHVLDLRPLAEEMSEAAAADSDAVLNGIAFDAHNRRVFVTGKLWPTMFEIRLPDLNPPAPETSTP